MHLTSSDWPTLIAHTSVRWAWETNMYLERGNKNKGLMCRFLIVEMNSWQASCISLFKPTFYLLLTFSKAAVFSWVTFIGHSRNETSQTQVRWVTGQYEDWLYWNWVFNLISTFSGLILMLSRQTRLYVAWYWQPFLSSSYSLWCYSLHSLLSLLLHLYQHLLIILWFKTSFSLLSIFIFVKYLFI